MKTLDYFRKRKADHEKTMEQLALNLERMKQNRAALESEINTAIDYDDMATVEMLTEKETEIEVKILAAEKFLERKSATFHLEREELITANNAEQENYQAKIDPLMENARKYHRKYVDCLLNAGKIVEQAANTRDEYLTLAGGPGRDDASFSCARGGFGEMITPFDQAIANEIEPASGASYLWITKA